MMYPNLRLINFYLRFLKTDVRHIGIIGLLAFSIFHREVLHDRAFLRRFLVLNLTGSRDLGVANDPIFGITNLDLPIHYNTPYSVRKATLEDAC